MIRSKVCSVEKVSSRFRFKKSRTKIIFNSFSTSGMKREMEGTDEQKKHLSNLPCEAPDEDEALGGLGCQRASDLNYFLPL